MTGHNIVDVATLENLMIRLAQPEEKVPSLVYVTTWPKPTELSVETYVRTRSLPQELQEKIREHVRGTLIKEGTE